MSITVQSVAAHNPRDVRSGVLSFGDFFVEYDGNRRTFTGARSQSQEFSGIIAWCHLLASNAG